jgi:hypothetical protein
MGFGYFINIIEIPFLLDELDEVNEFTRARGEALPCFYTFFKPGYALQDSPRFFLVFPEILRAALLLKLFYFSLYPVNVKGAPWLCLYAPSVPVHHEGFR